jgi:tetratricopeptide (TPR) repeat protein
VATTLNPSEEAQLAQTIEMFEVITQSQPQDYQSLEILKEAYSKLNRQKEVVATSKRIAQAYVQMGQLSSAILEYETILQQFPDDPDVQSALKEIESKSNTYSAQPLVTETPANKLSSGAPKPKKVPGKTTPADFEDGRAMMFKIFVDSKIITAGDFDLCWPAADAIAQAHGVVEPFIQVLGDKNILLQDKSLKLLSDKSRLPFLPLDKYDVDIDLARSFPAQVCRRWCVLPFDRMSKSVLVATANPFNQQAAKELAEATKNRLLFYLASPIEIVKNLQKTFR